MTEHNVQWSPASMCMSVCLSGDVFLHYCTHFTVTLWNVRQCPPVLHLEIISKSVHRFCCYGNRHVTYIYIYIYTQQKCSCRTRHISYSVYYWLSLVHTHNVIFNAAWHGLSLLEWLFLHCVLKRPQHFSLQLEHALLDFNNFWQKCFVENRKLEDGIFSHLT